MTGLLGKGVWSTGQACGRARARRNYHSTGGHPRSRIQFHTYSTCSTHDWRLSDEIDPRATIAELSRPSKDAHDSSVIINLVANGEPNPAAKIRKPAHWLC